MVSIERVWGGVKIFYANETGLPVMGGFNTYLDGAIQHTYATRPEFGLIQPGQTASATFPLSLWPVGGAEGKHNIMVEFLPQNPEVEFGKGLPGEFLGPTEMSNVIEADFSPFPWLPVGLVLGGIALVVAKRNRRR